MYRKQLLPVCTSKPGGEDDVPAAVGCLGTDVVGTARDSCEAPESARWERELGRALLGTTGHACQSDNAFTLGPAMPLLDLTPRILPHAPRSSSVCESQRRESSQLSTHGSRPRFPPRPHRARPHKADRTHTRGPGRGRGARRRDVRAEQPTHRRGAGMLAAPAEGTLQGTT